MNKKIFLLFSGYNERAVFALCYFFETRNLKFTIVARNDSDKILKTRWHKNVSWTRTSDDINISIFQYISKKIIGFDNIIYCPTTEFINNFFNINIETLSYLGYETVIANKKIYDVLTNKFSSKDFVKNNFGIDAPPEKRINSNSFPIIIKPKKNIINNKSHYPIIIKNKEELARAAATLELREWFAQSYIIGQSYYFCAYITKKFNHRHYWQKNFIQQDAGKSIVLAKNSLNPGVDEERIINKLIEIKYRGPIMIEFIKTASDEIFFIEINPRFWGPLGLAIKCNSDLLKIFAADALDESFEENDYWYSWKEGYDETSKKYPCFSSIEKEFKNLILKNDIYEFVKNETK